MEDVLGELDGNEECESDSEDEFDGYVDTGERTEEVEPVEPDTFSASLAENLFIYVP